MRLTRREWSEAAKVNSKKTPCATHACWPIFISEIYGFFSHSPHGTAANVKKLYFSKSDRRKVCQTHTAAVRHLRREKKANFVGVQRLFLGLESDSVFSYSLDGANWRQRKKSAVYKWCGAISTETKPKRSCKCAFRITSTNSFCLFQFQGSFHRRSLRVHKRKKKRPKSNCTRELPHHTNECISAARLHNEPRRIEIFFVSRARAHWMWKLKTQFIALFTLRRSFVLAMRANQNCGMNALRRVTFN